MPTQRWHTDENRNAGRIRSQLLAPSVPACTWDGCASLGLNGTTPRSRGSRHSLHSEHSASAHNHIQAISVQDGRAQAPPPTPCLIRTPGPPEQARAPQHSHSTAHAAPHAPQLARADHTAEPASQQCASVRVLAARLEPRSCSSKLRLRIGCAQNPFVQVSAGRHASQR